MIFDRFLPGGEDQRRWRGLLNETQMLCHSLGTQPQTRVQGGPHWVACGSVAEDPAAGEAGPAHPAGWRLLSRGLLALCPGVGGDELIVERAPARAVMRADPSAWLRALAELEQRLTGLLEDCEALYVHPEKDLVPLALGFGPGAGGAGNARCSIAWMRIPACRAAYNATKVYNRPLC